MKCKELGLKECYFCRTPSIKNRHKRCDVDLYLDDINSYQSKNDVVKRILSVIKDDAKNVWHYSQYYIAAIKISKYKGLYEKLLVLI